MTLMGYDIVYVARWQEYGGGYATADTLGKLQLIVFGQAYAPSRAGVQFTSYQRSQCNS